MGATILQIEHAQGMLCERRSILESRGYAVVSVLGAVDAMDGLLLRLPISAVVIGHGIAWTERQEIIAYFKKHAPGVPVISLIGMRNDKPGDADFSCPADNPVEWLRTLAQAVESQMQRRIRP